MSTAVQIITEAYRHHNLDEVTTFSTSLEFPYNIAKDVLNSVIREMNRVGPFWFTETETSLTYSAGVISYTLSSNNIDPNRVIQVRKTATNYWGALSQYEYNQFLDKFRKTSVTTTQPSAWAKFGDTLYLDVYPDQDYTIKVLHFRDLPVVNATTDTFLIPERDEDILIDNCYQMLGYRLGKWDVGTALQAIAAKTRPLLANMKQDSGLARQMPAAF